MTVERLVRAVITVAMLVVVAVVVLALAASLVDGGPLTTHLIIFLGSGALVLIAVALIVVMWSDPL